MLYDFKSLCTKSETYKTRLFWFHISLLLQHILIPSGTKFEISKNVTRNISAVAIQKHLSSPLSFHVAGNRSTTNPTVKFSKIYSVRKSSYCNEKYLAGYSDLLRIFISFEIALYISSNLSRILPFCVIFDILVSPKTCLTQPIT